MPLQMKLAHRWHWRNSIAMMHTHLSARVKKSIYQEVRLLQWSHLQLYFGVQHVFFSLLLILFLVTDPLHLSPLKGSINYKDKKLFVCFSTDAKLQNFLSRKILSLILRGWDKNQDIFTIISQASKTEIGLKCINRNGLSFYHLDWDPSIVN